MSQRKEEIWRQEGMSFCTKWLEEHDNDVDSLLAEVKRRGAYNVPIAITKPEEEEFVNRVKNNCVDTILILSLMTLHDEFGFGRERLNRFRKRFSLKADCISEDYTSWKDQIQTLEDECHMDLSIRWNGGDSEEAAPHKEEDAHNQRHTRLVSGDPDH